MTLQHKVAQNWNTKQEEDQFLKYHLKLLLEFFVENGFKVAEIARLIGVSKRTVERRVKDYDLGIRQSYSPLTDHELEDEVKKVINDFPHVGYRTMSGLLQVKGHRVQEKRIRHAMQNADSCGVLFRRLFLSASRVQRRTYSVKAPQALWHIMEIIS